MVLTAGVEGGAEAERRDRFDGGTGTGSGEAGRLVCIKARDGICFVRSDYAAAGFLTGSDLGCKKIAGV